MSKHAVSKQDAAHLSRSATLDRRLEVVGGASFAAIFAGIVSSLAIGGRIWVTIVPMLFALLSTLTKILIRRSAEKFDKEHRNLLGAEEFSVHRLALLYTGPRTALIDFLSEHLSSLEIRDVVFLHIENATMPDVLTRPAAETAVIAVETLIDRGAIDSGFFRLLRERLPHRGAQIELLEQKFADARMNG